MLTFVETRLFSRLVGDYLAEDDYALLQVWLLLHPEGGAVIPGAGEVRKLRWSARGRGKRRGLRILHYLRFGRSEIWMLTIYAKSEAADIPLHLLRKIREEIDG